MAIRYPRGIGEDDPVKQKEFEAAGKEAIEEIIKECNRRAEEFEKKCRVTKAQMESEYTI